MTEDLFENMDSHTSSNEDTLGYDPSPDVRKKIEKLLKDDKDQQKRSWSYYQEMRKSDPRKYHLPKTQLQMHRDAQALGDKFEDGDFSDE